MTPVFIPTFNFLSRKQEITSDLVGVFYQPSRMAITHDLASVLCWVSQMASCLISSFIRTSVKCGASSYYVCRVLMTRNAPRKLSIK